MATLRLPSFSEVRNLFTTDDDRKSSGSSSARDFVRDAYQKTGGATEDLKRVYHSYVENERRRKAAKGWKAAGLETF
jgi:hypothetical protein